MGANSSQRATPVMGLPLSAGVLPDPDRTTDEAGRIGVGFEGVVGNEAGLVVTRRPARNNVARLFDRATETRNCGIT